MLRTPAGIYSTFPPKVDAECFGKSWISCLELPENCRRRREDGELRWSSQSTDSEPTAASGACQQAPEAPFYLDIEITEMTALIHKVQYRSRASDKSPKCFLYKFGQLLTSFPLLTFCSRASFYRRRLQHLLRGSVVGICLEPRLDLEMVDV